MRRGLSGFAALLLTFGAATPRAPAQDLRALAAGVTAFDRGELRRASALFEDTARGATEPPLRARAWVYLGFAQMRLRDLVGARRSFGAAVLEAPDLVADARRAPPDALSELEAMRQLVTGELHVEASEAGALVRVDGRDRGPSPLVLRLPAGKHRIELVSTDGDRVFDDAAVEVVAGGSSVLKAALQPTPAATARMEKAAVERAEVARLAAETARVESEKARRAQEAAEAQRRDRIRAETRRQAGLRQAEAQRRTAAIAVRRAAHEARQKKAQRWRRTGYVLLAAGLALGAGGGVFAYLGSRQNDRIAQGGFDTGRAIADAASTGALYNTAGWIFGATGAALVVGAIPLMLVNRDPGPFRWTAVPIQGGAALAFGGHF